MGFSRFMDEIGVRNMWLYRRPPVEGTPADARRLIGSPPDELHVPVTAPAFAREELDERDGVKVDRLCFASQRPSGHAPVDTVHLTRLSRRDGPGAGRRALVLAHGAYAASLAKPLVFAPDARTAAWDTVALELPHHITRQRPDSLYSGAHMVTGDVVRITNGILQADADIRATVLGLRAMGYEKIVIGGISIGASPTMQALQNIEVDGAFGLVPSVDAYLGLWCSLLGRALRPAGNRAGIDDDLAHEVLRIITPRELGEPRIDPANVLLVYGVDDLVCVPKEARDLSRAWGGCVLRELPCGHATFIMFYPRVRQIVRAWVDRCMTRTTRR
jgi:hypothetical protein